MIHEGSRFIARVAVATVIMVLIVGMISAAMGQDHACFYRRATSLLLAILVGIFGELVELNHWRGWTTESVATKRNAGAEAGHDV